VINTALIDAESIKGKIFQIRGKRVMLDQNLASLYMVETKQLKRQVRRNIKRFPIDFMFELTREEYNNYLRCQNGTLEIGKYSKYLPYVFTEQGVAMLSSILNSERAILVNIQIIRTFVALRKAALTYDGLRRKITTMEKKYDAHFKIVFEALKKLLEPPVSKERRIIGFHPN